MPVQSILLILHLLIRQFVEVVSGVDWESQDVGSVGENCPPNFQRYDDAACKEQYEASPKASYRRRVMQASAYKHDKREPMLFDLCDNSGRR